MSWIQFNIVWYDKNQDNLINAQKVRDYLNLEIAHQIC